MTEEGRRHRSHQGILLGLMLLATALSVAHLDRPSLFYDEVIALDLACQPGPGALLARLLKNDATRAPLHPLLLQVWFAMFGASGASGRALSVACSVLTLPLVDRIGRRAFGPATGLWAAFLFAISPMQVRYAQELRMYALLVLETCAAWDLLLSFRGSAPPGKQAAFLACLVALGYTHPLGLFMVAALGIAYLATRRGSLLSTGRWLAIQALAALAVAPWAIHYVDHPPDITTARLPLKFLIGLPIGFIGGNFLALVGFAALAAYGMVARAGDAGRRWAIDRPSETAAVLIWFAVPPLLLYGHSLVSPSPIFGPPRYTLFVGPAYLLLVARGLAKLPSWPRSAAAVVCVALAAALLRTLVYAPDVKPDWRAAATQIRAVDPRSPVVLLAESATDRGQFVPLRYYLGPGGNRDLSTMSNALRRLADDPAALGEAAWVAVETTDGRPKDAPPPDWLDRFAPSLTSWKFPGVEIRYYRLRRPPMPARTEPDPAPGGAVHPRPGPGGER